MAKATIKAVLLNDTRNDRHHGCFTVVESVYRLAAHSNIDIIATAPAHKDWRSDRKVITAIDQAALVIVNAEGTIHHNRQSAGFLLSVGEYAKSLGKACALINMTWEANGVEYSQMAAAFDIVTVRESASEAELNNASIACRRIPDLALYHQPRPATSRSGIAYSDCVNGWRALALYQRMRPVGAKAVSILYGRRTIYDFLTLLHRLLPKKSFLNPALALAAVRCVSADWNAQTSDRGRFAGEVASTRLIVTGRFHMLIFALITRTPFLVISSNTHKNEATLADTGLAPWRHVEIEEIDSSTLERAMSWQDGESQQLESFIAKSRADMTALFDGMRDLAR